MKLKNLGILWAQYGPYHFARVASLKKLAGSISVHPLELASQTVDYGWSRSMPFGLVTLFPGEVVEHLGFWPVFFGARRVFSDLKLDACILPSYMPKQSLAAFLAAKSLGVRTVMMNDSHPGTAQVSGVANRVKRLLVSAFDSGLVAGLPHKRYFASMGLPAEKIFTGYDAVDNDYFADKAAVIRREESSSRAKYGLPPHYFLSLGRFVVKKNLPTLIRAFRQLLSNNPGCQTHLVMVGSGEEENKLRNLCTGLQLPVYDKSGATKENSIPGTQNQPPGVHFYGFRQIDENPVFYALADAFILPSSWEEWGLVINEAMASGLPVVVSETVGCAEDLLEKGSPPGISIERLDPPLKMVSGLRQNGFVFRPDSTEALADILLDLANHPSLRTAMGQAGRRIVEKVSCDNFARNAVYAARVALGEEPSLFQDINSGGNPMGPDSKLIS